MKNILRTLLVKLSASDLVGNRFYVMGLAIQKGSALLIIPLIVHAFGTDLYADYILIYSSVQVLATVLSVAVAGAVIPFWYYQKDTAFFATATLLLILGLFIVLAIPGSAVLYSLAPLLSIRLSSIEFAGWLLLYGLVYNLNAFFMNLIRVRGAQRQFFWAVVFNLAMYATMIIVVGQIGFKRLDVLVGIHVLALAFLTGLLCVGTEFSMPKKIWVGMRKTWAEILHFSWPMCLYTMAALLSMSMDKWVVKMTFDKRVFSQYVIDYQFSLSVMLLPMAVGIYNSTILSALVARGDQCGVQKNLSNNRLLNFLGSCVISVAVYFYATFFNVILSWGYWILAASFAIEGFYVLNNNVLMAEKRSKCLLKIIVTATIIYGCLLVISMKAENISFIYVSNLVYTYLLVSLSWLSLRGRNTNPVDKRDG